MWVADVVAIAREIAIRAHDGQVDKAGRAYVGHPGGVAARVEAAGGSQALVAAAWLHDVLEDTDVSSFDLVEAGIPVGVVATVEALTKREGESLDAYCQRVRADEGALMVKAADLEDNSDPARVELLEPSVRSRLADKYMRTRALLGI